MATTHTKTKARVLTAEDVKNIRYPIPESWKKAAGMLKRRKHLVDPLKYQRSIRKEWEKRLQRQIKLASRKYLWHLIQTFSLLSPSRRSYQKHLDRDGRACANSPVCSYCAYSYVAKEWPRRSTTASTVESMTKKTIGWTAHSKVQCGIAATANTQDTQKIAQASLSSLSGSCQASSRVGQAAIKMALRLIMIPKGYLPGAHEGEYLGFSYGFIR